MALMDDMPTGIVILIAQQSSTRHVLVEIMYIGAWIWDFRVFPHVERCSNIHADKGI